MTYKIKLSYILFFIVLPGLISLSHAAEFDAVLDWHKKVTLSTPVSGVVSVIPVSRGDTVNKNDVLLKLDDRSLLADIERYQSDVVHNQALLRETRLELERTLELYDRQLLAMHDRDIAQIRLAQAEAGLINAEADLKKAKISLEYSILQAPFNAIVLELLVNPNEAVVNHQQAEPLIVLAERGKMQARTLASPEQLADIKPGQAVTVAINNDSFSGSVLDIGFEPVTAGSKYEVRVLFDSGEKLLRAGQNARVLLP